MLCACLAFVAKVHLSSAVAWDAICKRMIQDTVKVFRMTDDAFTTLSTGAWKKRVIISESIVASRRPNPLFNLRSVRMQGGDYH